MSCGIKTSYVVDILLSNCGKCIMAKTEVVSFVIKSARIGVKLINDFVVLLFFLNFYVILILLLKFSTLNYLIFMIFFFLTSCSFPPRIIFIFMVSFFPISCSFHCELFLFSLDFFPISWSVLPRIIIF